MSDGGKGSKPRPRSISQAEYDARWDAIFGRDLQEEDQHHQQNANTDVQDDGAKVVKGYN